MKTPAALLAFALVVIGWKAPAVAEVVIQAEKAATKTEGGPVPGGWNLWSNGYVGQALRITAAGKYGIVVRAWGSPAGGVWPEMALLVDGRAVKTVSVNQAKPKDYAFQVELTIGDHEIAAAFLNDALVGKEDRNLYLARITISPPSGAPDPTFPGVKQMAEAAEAREQAIVAATKPDIEKNRKADAKIRVVDAAGRPVPGVKLTIEQTSHDFLFGANIFGFDRYKTEALNAEYKKRFDDLLNYATVGFYWRWYEPQQGKPGYEYTDKVVAWCREHGIRMKGHPLLWADQAGIPVWSKGQPSAEVQRQRVEAILHRYGGKIEFWEVVNEPSHLPGLKIDDPYRWARQADPKAYLIVNDYHVLPDGAPAFFKLLTEVKQKGVPFDGIGIQAHEPRTMRFPLDRAQKVLDQYATLGKELHITEFEPAGSGQKITGSHRQGVWDEAAQADYAVKFYRVCFAHPAMRAITWWDLGDQGSFIPGGGMLRQDLSPKPVYEQLKRLIHEEWKTRASGTTNAEGRFAFRGFFGTYRIAVAVPGKTIEKQFHLEKGNANEITISLDAHAASPKSFRPGEIWPDNNGVHINAHGGGILLHEGTYYWFGQHMVEGEAGNAAQVGVHVYSSKDLYGWKDEAVALRVSDDPKSDITKGCVLERPKVLYNRKTGKFVMWFHLELKGRGYGAARSGVAVADQPTGPYRFAGSFRPDAGAWPLNVAEELKKPLTAEEQGSLRKFRLGGGPEPDFPVNLIFRRDFAGGQMARDMTLFQDDDGTGYHIYASEDNSTLHISQLADDYEKSAGKYVRVFPGGFHEAPAMFKHNGKYYLITSGCTGWAPNTARLAVADSIWGPWKELGNPCVGKNAALTFDGQSTHVLPAPGKPGAFIFMADRWRPKNAIDGRHLWLPIQFKESRPVIEWLDQWDLGFFDRPTAGQDTDDFILE